jgi:hypothetical protein
MQFQAIVSGQSHRINCITQARALTILFDLHRGRVRSALQLLHILKDENVTESLLEFCPEIEPGNGQLETICYAFNIKIRRPQTLELARSYYCDG